MTLFNIDASSSTLDATLLTLFAHLSTLSFNLEDTAFMIQGSSRSVPVFLKLIQCASQTLQEIYFRNRSACHPQLPQMQEHFLEKLFHAPQADEQAQEIPLVFPNLRMLTLRSMIFNTPSLIGFISQQPELEYIRFEFSYLATIGYTWDDVAVALPSSCKELYIMNCGHERYTPQSPVAYNHIKPFNPYEHVSLGAQEWQTSDALFEQNGATFRRCEQVSMDETLGSSG
ncbi:MAG: hypothetical protein EOO38_10285 [Cytophagaceae bacterium]|nr:MAG: hypothetical protein EOO38_10285 [Cytophagaceae bacterium]